MSRKSLKDYIYIDIKKLKVYISDFKKVRKSVKD